MLLKFAPLWMQINKLVLIVEPDVNVWLFIYGKPSVILNPKVIEGASMDQKD